MAYEIVFDNREGYVLFIERKRINDAQLQGEKIAYDALKARALLDRPIAHAGMAAIAKAFADFKTFSVATTRKINLGDNVGYIEIERV